MVSVACAEEGNVALFLKNINTNEVIDNVVVYVESGKETLSQHVGLNESLNLEMDEGIHTITLKIDTPSTSGKDFFKKQSIDVEGALKDEVFLFPVGSLRGMVKDVFDNVVGSADLRFECTNEIGADMPEKTNKYGSFSVDYMPSGSCKIFANYGDAVGFTEVNVVQGNITDIEILLDRTILKISKSDYGIQGAVVLLFLIVVILLAVRYRKKKKPKKEIHKIIVHKHETKHDRAKDILSTLNRKEKGIVEYLMGKGEVNQSKIRHNTGIPRTSLSRILVSLEHKKVIHIKKVGKLVKVKLTDWFLGKD
ncbi:hypothetical protein JW707_00815 [Candidatus Woesearchaeota archaeon]|nr:hypothetical protein [Candidatus Woesearchaeota archaeon]